MLYSRLFSSAEEGISAFTELWVAGGSAGRKKIPSLSFVIWEEREQMG